MSRRSGNPVPLCIDGLVLVDEHFSGIGQYTHGLVAALDRVLDRPQQDVAALRVLLPRRGRRSLRERQYRHVDARTLPLSGRSMERLGYRGALPPVDLVAGAGVYLFPHFTRMPLLRSRSVVLVHDLSYLHHPEFLTPRYARFLRRHVAGSIRRADAVLTPTDAIRHEVLAAYRVDPAHVVVGNAAVDPAMMRRRLPAETAAVNARYGFPPGGYFLFLGNLEPRKNVTAVLRAYRSLPADVAATHPLVLVSAGTWKNEHVGSAIRHMQRQGYRVLLPSTYVSDEDKAAVLSGALALVYPSHYEGFGIPVLEALACGVPVVTSHDTAITEVSGDAALHVDADDIAGIAAMMLRCIRDASLRAEAAVRGPARAARFSWDRTAGRYIELAQRLWA